MDSLKEMLGFLKISARLDLKSVALTYVLSLTGSPEGLSLVISLEELLIALVNLTQDNSDVISKDAALCLINISARDDGSISLMKAANSDLINLSIKNITNPESNIADPCCMILSNISRTPSLAQKTIDLLCKSYNDKVEANEESLINVLEQLITCFVNINYNKNAKLHYLGPLFSNISQCAMGRSAFIVPRTFLLGRLIPFTSYEPSVVRRGGAIGLLRNLCLDKDLHQILLGQDCSVDILPFILMPLAGPEEFDDETNDKLPLQLQYLGADKEREPDSDLRVMLLECLEQLCATRDMRNTLRDRGCYEILREYHKWESARVKREQCDRAALLACENVVDILIRTEDEIGEDDLTKIEVPNDLVEKFNKMDKEFLEDV